ncbi:MAG: metallophosphoesterase [Planctomycetota bacterium]
MTRRHAWRWAAMGWAVLALTCAGVATAQRGGGDLPQVRTDYEATSLPAADEPITEAVWATWQRDPTTTLTVHWLGPLDRRWASASICAADEAEAASEQGVPAALYTTIPAGARPMPGTHDRVIYVAEFVGLEPNTAYLVAVPGRERPVRLRTLPADPEAPLRFAAGGCVYKDKRPFERMVKAVAHHDPHFALIAGDIAYADGDVEQAYRWLYLLATWENLARRADGSLIPFVMAIGNHEVSAGGRGRTKAFAPFFYSLFAFPAPAGYGVLDIGEHLSIFLLDSGHTNSVPGHQTDWLADELEARADRTHLIAAYHVPAYPSARSFSNTKNREVRRHWTPLFDAFGVDLVIEADDHAYKRTLPLLGGKPHPRGTVYVGDGGFGMHSLRTPADPGTGSIFGNRRAYLAHTAEKTHGELITIHGNERTILAMDPEGLIFDSYRFSADQPHAIDATPHTGFLFRPEGYLLVVALLLGIAGYFGYTGWRRSQRPPATGA